MPYKSAKKRAPPSSTKNAQETYSSDGGFVANDDGEDEPRAKRLKTKNAKASGKVDRAGEKGKKGKMEEKVVAGGGRVGANGEEFWELSDKRRISLSSFGGKLMVSIREYYEKDGESLPGKKGISLPLEQFRTLITLLPHIEGVLVAKGESVPRPVYGAGEGEDTAAAAASEEEGEDEKTKEEDGEEGEEENGDGNDSGSEDVKGGVKSGATKSRKRNFEQTSEEEEED